jgi:hypothetical protein
MLKILNITASSNFCVGRLNSKYVKKYAANGVFKPSQRNNKIVQKQNFELPRIPC